MKNKELTPLEALNLIAIGQCKGKRKQYIGIVNKALNDYEKQIKALEHINKRLKNKLFELEDKELKAFEIIKDNFIWLEDDEDIFVGIPYDCEIKLTKDEFDTEEEYNLLKEVLGDEQKAKETH